MGGGAMRAAAKVAGVTLANGGLRGITSDHYPVFSATRRAASFRPATAMVDDVKLVASQSHDGLNTTSSEIEDWVFAGGEEVFLSDTDVMMPKVVFDGSPTLQEAKEATSELAFALEKAYLSKLDSVGHDGSVVADQGTCLSISGSPVIINKSCVTSENGIAPAVPNHAIKAFRLLHDSHAAQNVVASIACDPNVWNAVLHNRELQEFLQSQRTCSPHSNMNELSEENSDVSSEYAESKPDIGLIDIVQKVKITVVDMMINLSDYFHNLFGGEGVNRVMCTSSGRNTSSETVMETSFVGLAVMAIMVILVKRDSN